MYKPAVGLSSNGTIKVLPGKPVYATTAWAYPEGTAKVDIQLDASTPLMTDVAVPR